MKETNPDTKEETRSGADWFWISDGTHEGRPIGTIVISDGDYKN